LVKNPEGEWAPSRYRRKDMRTKHQNHRGLTALLIGLMVAFSATAALAAPKPSGDTDDDGDGYFSDDPVDALKDCADDAPGVHPGAREVFDNGVDDNCDGNAYEMPPSGVLSVFKVRASNRRAALTLAKNISTCEDDAECTVDVTNGKFVTTDGNHIVRRGCGRLISIIDDDALAALKLEDKERGPRCRRRGGGGMGKKAKAKLLAEAEAKAAALLLVETEKRLEAEAEAKRVRDARWENQVEVNAAVETDIGLLDGRVGELETGQETAAEERSKLSNSIGALGTRVGILESYGPLAEFTLGLGGLFDQSDVELDGNEVRPTSAGGYMLGAQLGVESRNWRFGLFGEFVGLSEGDGSGRIFKGGPEVMVRPLRDLAVGAHLLWQSHTTGADAVEAEAQSSGWGIGPSLHYRLTNGGPAQVGLLARFSYIREEAGTKADGVETTSNKGNAWAGTLGLTVGFGATSK